MKILFINPPFQRLKGIAQIYFPLGLGYLCSYISTDRRIDALIYNAEVPSRLEQLPFHIRYQDMLNLHNRYIQAIKYDRHYVWQEVYKAVKEFNPDLIGITVLTAKYGSALRISQIAKSLNKSCKIVWGGPHASVDAERALENDTVDFVIRGEGEKTLKVLLDLLIEKRNDSREGLSNVQGLSYKVDSRILHNPDRPLIEDLDVLPYPSKNRVMFAERYLPSSWGDIITLRGCPFNCGYCGAHNIWTNKVRYRSPQSVSEEIRLVISKYRNREFYFWDDNFTLNRERTIQLCRLLKGLKNRISWGCTTRVDLLDGPLIKEMKQAGCNYVSIGIETGSSRLLKKITKA
ncbi:MAG: radical SAM protein [Candidatus Omnitrophota bacterium]